jgi:hypothetical protein
MQPTFAGPHPHRGQVVGLEQITVDGADTPTGGLTTLGRIDPKNVSTDRTPHCDAVGSDLPVVEGELGLAV